MSAPILLAVAAGGAAGSVARYLVALFAARAFGTALPWGTLAVNVVGSFAIGWLAGVLSRSASDLARPLLLSGFLGGFTTFSAFALETMTLPRPAAILYVALSLAGSLAACAAGLSLAR
jgi:CrcB protein